VKTFRVVIHTKAGQSLVTEETPEPDVEDFSDELVERIEDRDDPWKTIGHVTINFRDILAFEVEEIGAAA
jgi:hypothetical protein